MFHGAGVFGHLGCSCSSDGLIQAEANQTIRATTNTKGAKKNPKVVTHLYHVCLIWRIGNLKWESCHRWCVQVMTTTDRNCFTEAFGKPSACLGAPVARSEHRHRSRNTCLHNIYMVDMILPQPASIVLVVNGRVGFVEEGNTFGSPQT